MRKILLVICCLALSACAINPYEKHYVDQGSKNLPEKWRPNVKASDDPTNTPRLLLVSDQRAAINDALTNGFVSIGYSAFFGPANFEDSLAIKFGKTIGAELITLSKSNKDRVTEQVPTVVPIVSTTNSKFGSVTNVTAVGSSSTVGVDRFNYEAGYWYKSLRPAVFGARVKDLTAEERKSFGSNKGMKVFSVVKGTPAYSADVLLDDILLKIGEQEINTQEDYGQALKTYQNTQATFVLRRDGKIIEGTAKMNHFE